MKLRQFSSLDEAATALAAQVAGALSAALAARAQATLAVPGGRTPVPLFHALRGVELDWGRVLVTLTDERWVPETHPGSNAAMVRRELLSGRASDAGFVPLFNGAVDAVHGAASASRTLAALLPFDVVVLGMGADGHFASLFAGAAGVEAALAADGLPGCVAVQAPVEPRERLSLNLAALATGATLSLLVNGADKLAVLGRARDGSDPSLPVAALLRLQPPPEVFWAP